MPCALQTALDESTENDSIYLSGATFTGSNNAVITLSKGVNIIGGWDGLSSMPPNIDPRAYPTIIDAEGARRGIYINGDFSLYIKGLRVTNGNASGLGGYEYYGIHDAGSGIYVYMATANISNCVIVSNNYVGGYGSGIYLGYTDSIVHENTITDNIAYTGGGIFIYHGTPIIKDNLITDNVAAQMGGGISCFSTSSALQHNMIANNTASVGGGGGINIASCSPEIRGNTIINNVAVKGGGIRLWYSRSLLVNNIIAGNRVNGSGSGSGIWMGGSKPIIKHATITRNTDGDGSGIFVGDAGTTHSALSLINTIIVDQTVGVLIDIDSSADINATLWGSGSWVNGENHAGGGVVNIGPVNTTGNPAFKDPDNRNYHIISVSGAIDAGIDAEVTKDIDGDIRPQGNGFDIGADELYTSPGFPIIFMPAILKRK